jgi:hypothetical protein
VFAHALSLNGRRRVVSLVTGELTAHADGTRVTYTEQYAFVEVTGDGEPDGPSAKAGRS